MDHLLTRNVQARDHDDNIKRKEAEETMKL